MILIDSRPEIENIVEKWANKIVFTDFRLLYKFSAEEQKIQFF